jgi:hypothetical protein
VTAEGRPTLAAAEAIEAAVPDATRTIRSAKLEMAGGVLHLRVRPDQW